MNYFNYPIIKLDGSERWERAYDVGNELTERFPDSEAQDFAYAIHYNPQDIPDAVKGLGIVNLRCTQIGENDNGSWIWVIQLTNNVTYRVEGSCDYTGWDCQSGTEWTELP